MDFGYNKVEIKVAAENEVVKTYTINITREIDEEYTLGDLQSDNLLKAIEIPGYDIDFNPSINEYNIILKDDEKTLTVKGLDAIDGTAVLDIKPYYPVYDKKEATVPEWVDRLMEHYF